MLQMSLGLEDLTLVNAMSSYGSTAGTMLQYGAHAIDAGQANVVACVFADAPLARAALRRSRPTAAATSAATGLAGLPLAYGDYGPANTGYALALRRHMHLYGTTHDQLGHDRRRPARVGADEPARADAGKPMTLEDYHASRWIVEPLHLFDCCLVSNGGVAVIVTSAERARDLKPAAGLPARLRPGRARRQPACRARARASTPARGCSGELALRDGRRRRSTDVDVLELYDCYTYTVLVTLEDYGFCAKGEGGAFVEDGKLGPGGSLPTNTGGGQLSAYYMWGFTPLSEGVIQARGQGGERQVDEARPRARQRQRRHAQLALDDDPEHGTRARTAVQTSRRRLGPSAVPATRRAGRSSTARCEGRADAAALPATAARSCAPTAGIGTPLGRGASRASRADARRGRRRAARERSTAYVDHAPASTTPRSPTRCPTTSPSSSSTRACA